jgi:hypothetical protein
MSTLLVSPNKIIQSTKKENCRDWLASPNFMVIFGKFDCMCETTTMVVCTMVFKIVLASTLISWCAITNNWLCVLLIHFEQLILNEKKRLSVLFRPQKYESYTSHDGKLK